jgi:hypothetical protein
MLVLIWDRREDLECLFRYWGLFRVVMIHTIQTLMKWGVFEDILELWFYAIG